MSRDKLNKIIDYLIFLAGGIIYSLSLNTFLAPNLIAPGGASGLATIINYIFGLPIGIMYFVINIPLFLWGRKILGREFLIKTLVVTIALSVMTDILSFLPVYENDRLLASIFGGALNGFALGIVFARGATSGGSDLLARIIRVKKPHLTMGELVLYIDAFVIILSAIVFKNIESGFYAFITIYISTHVIDSILIGLDVAKIIYIISDKNEQIAKRIIEEIGRGATLLSGKGFFTGLERPVLFIAVKKYQIYSVKRIVRETDGNAFMIFTDATEVLGEGFKLKDI